MSDPTVTLEPGALEAMAEGTTFVNGVTLKMRKGKLLVMPDVVLSDDQMIIVSANKFREMEAHFKRLGITFRAAFVGAERRKEATRMGCKTKKGGGVKK